MQEADVCLEPSIRAKWQMVLSVASRKSTNTIAAKTQGALHLLIIHLQADEAALIWPLLFLHSLAPDDEAKLQAGESPQIFGLEATRAER